MLAWRFSAVSRKSATRVFRSFGKRIVVMDMAATNVKADSV